MSVIVTLTLTLGGFYNVSASSNAAPQMAVNTYYVSVTGSDANHCTQPSAPCKSFNKAMSLAQAGDVISVMPGTYNQQLVISKSGITVEGNGAIINTTTQNGIKVSATAQNVIVRGFTVTKTWSHAIFVEGKFVTVENNTVYHSIMENGALSNGVITCGNAQWGSGIKAERGSSDVVIRNNTVYENCGEGIAATMGINVVIEGNTVYDNYAVNIYLDNSPFAIARNNIVYCTGINLRNGKRATGIASAEESYSGWGTQRHDAKIIGNKVNGCDAGVASWQSEISTGKEVRLLVAENQVFGTIGRSIELNTTNVDVVVRDNVSDKAVFVRYPAGAQLTNNTVSTSSSTPEVVLTGTPFWTLTPTNTSTPTSVLPIATQTSALPTATAIFTPTFIFVLPTITPTSIPPLIIPSATALPESPVPVLTSEAPINASQLIPEIIYDDKDGGLIYSDGWENVSKNNAHGGSYKVTRRNDSFATFTFTGESFSILYSSGPSFRKIEVYVDDVLVGTINEKTKSIKFQQRWDYSGQLTPGPHTLKLVFVAKNNSSKAYGSLDAVIVR